MSQLRSFRSLTLLLVASACVSAGGGTSASSISIPQPSILTTSADMVGPNASEIGCASECEAIPMPSDVTQAIETRISNLKARGGDCSRYASVLETSYRSGRITLRPFMWRVGSHLASGAAKPNGEMTLAREIDSLNVGVRTVDDVVASMEHEAVHITFALASGIDASEVAADQYVRGCKT